MGIVFINRNGHVMDIFIILDIILANQLICLDRDVGAYYQRTL
jgi:hypothetical protein